MPNSFSVDDIHLETVSNMYQDMSIQQKYKPLIMTQIQDDSNMAAKISHMKRVMRKPVLVTKKSFLFFCYFLTVW